MTTTSNSANPNGYIPIVFTYGGTTLGSYQNILNTFYVTLPGGGGVQLGDNQYYGYSPGGGQQLTTGSSIPLSKAASSVDGLLPTNGVGVANLQAAFQNWATSQAASTGQEIYANLYLDLYTGGRVYLSNGDLELGTSGEPVPASPSDPAYDLLYGLFEPYVGAQVNSTTVPGNGADITDIDWFSFPISLKTWYFDFGDPTSTTLTNTVSGTTTEEIGGDGTSIYNALLISGSSDSPTNAYPNASLPSSEGSSAATRLVGPPSAAQASYYSDPAQNPFPYSFFDNYLTYLAGQQAKANNSSLFNLNGSFSGVGTQTTSTPANDQQQTFSFDVDFSHIKNQPFTYSSGSVVQITPNSSIILTGYTENSNGVQLLGSISDPFTLELPWAVGTSTYSLNFNPSTEAQNNALEGGSLNWLGQATPQTAPSGTYNPTQTVAFNSSGTSITPGNETGNTVIQLVFSVNADPLAGASNLDNLLNSNSVSLSNTVSVNPSSTAVIQTTESSVLAPLTISSDPSGTITSITVNDLGNTYLAKGATWNVPVNSGSLGNTEAFTITLDVEPALRDAFVLNSATYPEPPASLSLTVDAGSTTSTISLTVEPAGLATPGFSPDPTWTTLSQPAGIYGANSGYTISGLTGDNDTFNGSYTALENDVFGWVVGDLLAALNTGLVGSPVIDPTTRRPIGESSSNWFAPNTNPYVKGLWGQDAWELNGSPVMNNGEPINNFWNTWAYNLSTTNPDAYGFAFSDRFEEGILLGFNPPPANPDALYPVLLEVIIGDSPLMSQFATPAPMPPAPMPPAPMPPAPGGGGESDGVGVDPEGSAGLPAASANPAPIDAIIGQPAPILLGTPEDDRIIGTAGPDQLVGYAGDDILKGRRGDDQLRGGVGADKLRGGRGRDVLRGGVGADKLRGGRGRDLYVYNSLRGSGTGKGKRDVIDGSWRGSSRDRIDLSRLGVEFIESRPFTGAGQVRLASGGMLQISGRGDQSVFELKLKGNLEDFSAKNLIV